MAESIRHRGPDASGVLTCNEWGVTLAVERLSIVDIHYGHQPMSSGDNRISLVFNGEIFNAPSLRRQLQKDGHVFTTERSDTEVVLKLYEAYGPDLVSHLNGMFAFVILDRNRGTLFGARDRFGIKPLYYSTFGGRLAFASELKALRHADWIPLDIDLQAVYHYLSFQTVPAPHSIFSHIKKLPPATCFEFQIAFQRLKCWDYWRPEFDDNAELQVDMNDLQSLVVHELREAVRRWSLSDVPLGCSLSGGIDSSSVTALYATLFGENTLKTFTLGIRDEIQLDERRAAAEVSRTFGTQHHEILLAPEDLLTELDSMVWYLDEPYAGGLPSWFVYKAMGAEVKVALTGVGGDEIFGNYGKWITHEYWRARLSRLKPWRRPKLIRKWPQGTLYQPLYFDDAEKRAEVLAPEVSAELEPSEELIQRSWEASGQSSPRNAAAFVDFKQQLPNEFLHMIDRFSMAHSVEARTPFLDHAFVEAMLAIPAQIRTTRRDPKRLLRKSVENLVPRSVVGLPKRGFVVPHGKWLRTHLSERVQQLMNPNYLRKQGIFQERVSSNIVDRSLSTDVIYDERVWTLFMFQSWWARYMDS